MKFFRDLFITLLGLVLLISTAFTIFAVIGYFSGEVSGDDVLWLLKFTTPITVVSVAIGWWQRDVFKAMLAWMFPI